MSAPESITLTVQETRQVAARTAARYGATFDHRLLSIVDDIIEDVILVHALGPEHTREEGVEIWQDHKKGKQNE